MTLPEKLEIAVRMVKAGALRSAIVRETGLRADQIDEIKTRIRK